MILNIHKMSLQLKKVDIITIEVMINLEGDNIEKVFCG